MPSFRSLLFLILLLSATRTIAQQEARIIDPTAIVVDAQLKTSKHALAGMQAAGLSDETIAAALKHSDPQKWPLGWRTDSIRVSSGFALSNARVYRLSDHTIDDIRYSIIHMPAIENYHMPQELRSADDLYAVVRANGLGEPPPPEKLKASKGPSWRAMPKAKITRPEQVYATYDLREDLDAMRTLEKRGMSKPEIDAVIFRSHERNWPDGIDAFEKRHPKLKQFKKYKAHVAARWGDKVLVVIPAELNKDLPAGLRPYMDIYMVYTSPAVAVMKK